MVERYGAYIGGKWVDRESCETSPDTLETRNGFYVAPTIFGYCTNRMRFRQEETFGPVVGLARFKTADEAMALANDTRYDLLASIQTKDVLQGLSMADRIKAGTVWMTLARSAEMMD
jgi:acyl-CoA reductase-like NAD-dependent aldehyde dehydrogenase